MDLVKIINAETKEVLVANAEQEEIFLEQGFSYMEIEESFEGKFYIKGYAPQKPLEELKEAKRAEINAAREEARKTEGAEYDGDIFDVDETSQSNILAQIKVAELLKDTEAAYIYRSKTNKDHLLNVSELQELGLMIAQKVSNIYSKSWELKVEVDKATTAEEVEAIKWTLE